MFSKTIIAQTDRDRNVERLYEIMGNVYAIVNEAKPLKIQSHKLVIARMVQQTIDCGYFICSYAQNKNFCRMAHHHSRPFILLLLLIGVRAVKHLVTGADARITDYKAKFEELLTEFHWEAVRNTEITVVQTKITVLRILDDVESLGRWFAGFYEHFI